MDANTNLPPIVNETVRTYAPGSAHAESLQLLQIIGRTIIHDASAKYVSPFYFSTVARAIATEIAEITAAF